MILVLAGTIEGREVAKLLTAEGINVTVTVTSEYGAQILKKRGISNILVGELSEETLRDVLVKRNIKVVIDATHPFAAEISLLAMNVAASLNIFYLRLERKSIILPESPLVIAVRSLEKAVEKALDYGGPVFSTLGSKNLPYIVKRIKEKNEKIVARILPAPDILDKCLQMGLEMEEIIAMKGPFSRELNAALFKERGVRVVLTKESGEEGGLREKIEASLDCCIPCIVWKRPHMVYPRQVDSPRKAVKFVKEVLNV